MPLNSSNHCELIGTKTANQHESAHSWQQMSAIIKERFRAYLAKLEGCLSDLLTAGLSQLSDVGLNLLFCLFNRSDNHQLTMLQRRKETRIASINLLSNSPLSLGILGGLSEELAIALKKLQRRSLSRLN